MWNETHQIVLEKFAATFPPPREDAACRMWTGRLAEQFAFTFPTQGWGTKRADMGRPPSTDCICTLTPFIGYDVLLDQGLGTQTVAKYPGPLNLTGQIFLPVKATNHLALVTVPPVVVPPVAIDCGAKFPPRDEPLAALAALNAEYQRRGRPNRCAEGVEPLYIDNEGISVWYADYLQRRVRGVSHGEALAQTLAQLAAEWR